MEMMEILRPDAVGRGLNVMAISLLVDYLPRELENIIGTQQASIVIARIASQGAYNGFKEFLKVLGGKKLEDIDTLLRLFVRSGSERLHPFQVFSELEKVDGERYILRFERDIAEKVNATPSIAAVFGGVIAGCMAALGFNARFLPSGTSPRTLCASRDKPHFIIVSRDAELLVERLKC